MSKNLQVETEMSKISAMLVEQSHLRLLGSDSWTFPLQLADIQMKTVVRSQMDVLMKMILKILDRLEVKQANEISELLTVETIFVEHMLELMMQNKMVEKLETIYQLTTSGSMHLTKGTFAHDPMEEHVEIAFSSYHNESLERDYSRNVFDEDGNVPDFRFENETDLVDVKNLDELHIKQMIEDSGYEFLVENGQKLIEEICSVDLKESLRVVCLEFHLHDRTEDSFFIRVWNTWTGKFDPRFEDELNHKEASRLRKLYVG
ncbi:hypothetical protein [Paenisporosarcina antarctica]|uniref:Uncharacterized protein n=1 Tax=Paenisporosarcina antarctica TaxID=417367 RepID=A0A4P7A138_9BACL|nr:hypothetical protein [Paenisporosarcina antarctica]QBP42497.1 hypothetical protein E2636_15670 [Paenisporosarcina antarctica]